MTPIADRQASTSPGTTVAATARSVTITILAISAALLLFIAYSGMSLNRAAYTRQRSMIDEALTHLVTRVLMEQKAWAYWDEAVVRTRDPAGNAEWIDIQISSALSEGYGHEQIYLIAPDGRVAYGYDRGRRVGAERLAPLWPALQPLIREIRSGEPRPYRIRDQMFGQNQQRYNRLVGARAARWAANILYDGSSPVVVSAMTIMPVTGAVDVPEEPTLLLSVVRIDEAMINTLSESLRIRDLELVPGAPVSTKGSAPFVADDGTPLGTFTWSVAQPGRTTLTFVLPVCALLLVGALAYARHILRKLGEANARLHEQEASARYLALHDALSQLPNRRHFIQALRSRLEAAAAANAPPNLCVAYLDVDRFKDVNDAIGHGAGDALVMQIGPRLRAMLGRGDMLARLGGDEFAILHESDNADAAILLGETILSAFKRPFELEGQRIEVTASAGIALAHPGECDPERLLQQADISLYKAKDAGRNRYALFETTMAEEVRARHAIEHDLRAAIGTGQILIHYQPIISTRTGKVTTLEALVRWNHPRHGLIAPAAFIAIAEQSGLMMPLGDHILEMIFREASRFPVDIALNLSPVQLRHRHLPERLAQLARRFGVDPRQIILEITETLLLEANDVTTAVFVELRGMGFRIALDDFGTGYSSLSYLHRFAFDKIKIDRSFISSTDLAQLRPIIEGIVHIGRGLRMDIVAEGVETPAELAMVQAMGCSEAQGYLISRPVPAEEAIAFIQRPEVERAVAPAIQLAAR